MTCDRVREMLGEFVTGSLAPEEAAGIAGHLDACPACREEKREIESLDGLLKGLGPTAPAAAAPAAPRRVWGRVLSGAAAAALLATGALFWWPSGKGGRVHVLPEGERITGRGESVRTGPGQARPFSLPDGTRMRVGPGSEVRFVPAGPGERLRVELARGILEAEVEKGEGRVRVASDAGEITVLGTVFIARAFRLADSPVLAVEVTEGRVDLSGAAGVHPVPAGRRGIVRGGANPFACVQEMTSLAWREALSRWGKDAAAPGFAGRSECLTLLAGRWEGISGWDDVRTDPSASLEEKKRAAILEKLLSEPEEEKETR